MSTLRELTFLVSDLAKNLSDDAIINESHIMFLLGKYRTYLLKQKYDKEINSRIPSSNYQTICIDLIEVPMIPDCSDSCVCSTKVSKILRSKKKIPTLMDLGSVRVTGNNSFKENVTIVSPDRMEYVGYSRWLQNIVYGTVASDDYLYIKSNNKAFLELDRIRLTGIFEDTIMTSSQLLCEGECGCGDDCHCTEPCTCGTIPCDELDREFPLEDALITQLISLVVKEIIGAVWRPADKQNNANDDLAEIANFVRNYMKKPYNNTISNED